jgi:iron complex outermembrane receptor protein
MVRHPNRSCLRPRRARRVTRGCPARFVGIGAGLIAAAAAHAQPATPAHAPPASQQVTVTGQMLSAPLDVGGFGDAPLSRLPIAASVLGESRLRDAGAKSASDLARLDAAVSAAYDAEGYWTSISARGFQVDNRANFRRDGLPIHGETVIHLGNKRSLELLKGTSGMLAGTSAPGGLVNMVVKRPTSRLRGVTLDVNEYGGAGLSLDMAERFGPDDAFGLRVNAGYERLSPALRDAAGRKSLVALAGEWRGVSTLVEAEFEQSRQSQPSQPGFSLLGDRVPSADEIDPRINLNNQPWTLPVVLAGRTGSLRVTQTLTPQWKLVAHAMTQRLTNDDRVAFPYGVYDPSNYTCDVACDRYAADGTFTYWEFRSDGEKRRADALDLRIEGRADLGHTRHALAAGVLRSRQRAAFGPQLFDIAGIGRIDGSAIVPRSPGFLDVQTDRDEHSTEVYVRDAIELSSAWRLWAGLRHSRLDRASVRTDGSRATRYEQAITTPWIALGFEPMRGALAYASFGHGIETDVAPNRARYTNAGQPLPALRSRQAEAGIKIDGDSIDLGAAVFDINRPVAADIGACDDVDGSCTRRIDGSARHRGIEGLISWQHGPWQLHASGMLLDAKRRGSSNGSILGLRPVNVPKQTARLHGAYDLTALPGLALMASIVHEGARMALPDNSASIPAWTRLDLGARWRQSLDAGRVLTWRVGVDNATNERAWKEAPYQFGHAYLYPLAPRTLRASVQAGF